MSRKYKFKELCVAVVSVVALCSSSIMLVSANSTQSQKLNNTPVTSVVTTMPSKIATALPGNQNHQEDFTRNIQKQGQQNNTSNTVNNDQSIILHSSYKLSQIDKNTLTDLEDIVNDNKSSISINKNNGSLNIYMKLPNGSDSTTSINSPKIIEFSSFIENMDNMNNNSSISNGPVLLGAYRGQQIGEYVKWHTHVHCNRFNGPLSDHRYWTEGNPRALIDFYKSDCWYHAHKYHCNSKSKMSKCDGLDIRGHGVKDCSSWKGGKPHHNWSKRAWFRNKL